MCYTIYLRFNGYGHSYHGDSALFSNTILMLTNKFSQTKSSASYSTCNTSAVKGFVQYLLNYKCQDILP